MSRSQRYTNLKPYRYILNSHDPQGTCCVCDGRKIYTRKSVCDGLVDSYFAEGQRPSWGMHPCYGYSGNPEETGLCLYSNKQSTNSSITNSYECSSVTVGSLSNRGTINYCDYETMFGTNRLENKKDYEFRFIPLPSWSGCGSQSGSVVPMEFLGKDFARNSINLRRITVFDTAESQGEIKYPIHRNSGTILNIVKNETDVTKALQITELKDSNKRTVKRIKTRKLNADR